MLSLIKLEDKLSDSAHTRNILQEQSLDVSGNLRALRAASSKENVIYRVTLFGAKILYILAFKPLD